jgi:hypothetical protein
MSWAETSLAHPEIELVEIRPERTSRARRGSAWTHRQLSWDTSASRIPVSTEILRRSAIAYVEVDGPAGAEAAGSGILGRLLELAPLAIVVAPGPPERLASVLTGFAAPPAFVGTAPGSEDGRTAIAIVDRRVVPPLAAPTSLRILAVMTAYNEADIIGPALEALATVGIDVHLIDNWSTDGTYEIAQRSLGRGLVALERFPEAATPTFELGSLLQRVEAVAAASGADWAIHHDVDERRSGPWPARSLRDAIWSVHQSGFNAIDHTVLDFRPIDDGFVPGTDYATYFRHFEFGATPDLALQVKAWRNTGQPVRLADSGGHEAGFAGRRIFPYKFLLKHYPIRSQAHGERKVFAERRGRWNPVEREKGWHVHYDDIGPGHQFVRPTRGLTEFVDGETEQRLLVPIISGIGIFPSGVPSWATRDPLRAGAYRLGNRFASGSTSRGLRSVVGRLPLVGRPARWAWRRLMGAR